uniref:NADH dehydrogenase subunit 6 n=1 Tax=Megalodontes quinquecinctus TaxID=2491145 RepID=A0A3Q8UA57_9HYME|nr:NADH dehydrogenase subunit 6 [Megalodontes quinquecinctus]
MYYVIMSMNIMICIIMYKKFLHPLFMVSMLIIYTMNICLISSSIFMSSWYAYILFLVMMGGLLMLFTYMTSIVPNELMKNYSMNLSKLMFFITMTSIFWFLGLFKINYLYPLNVNFNNEIHMINSLFFSKYSFKITIIIMIYLLITLIIIMNISYSNKSLRMKM